MKERIRVGIIGAGWAGQTTAKFYRRLPWVDIVGWADIVPGKAAAAAAEFGVGPEAVFLDFREMLDKVDLDGVSVCSFNNGHREPTIAALERDKYVHLEKPMAATLDDAQAIMRAADRSKGQLLVGFQPFFSSEHRAAREIVKAGTLGDIYYAE
ncbi:MAG TPA: Gfo/Idh/MocA family oxidoreductase, partial [Chloroflexota bacterium]|nr:Gfo/Idh/MocA family oxidoreductase [Chloroflexota bacterium]